MGGILPVFMVILSIVAAIGKIQKAKQNWKTVPQVAKPIVSAPPKAEVAVPVSVPQPMSSFAPAPAVSGPEGEDACHAYMLEDEEKEVVFTRESEENEALAQDLLKGVIFSEILRRPQPRAYGRRQA